MAHNMLLKPLRDSALRRSPVPRPLMSSTRRLLASTAMLMLAMPCIAQAAIVNPGFETGDFTGWTVNDSNFVEILVSNVGAGAYSAQLRSGIAMDAYTTLSQTLSLSAGDVVSGQANWIGGDFLPNNDDGFVRLVGHATLFTADIATFGDSGSSGWTSFSYTVPTSGTFILESGVRNAGDNDFESYLQVDFEQIRSGVPEPGTASLIGLALLAAGVGVRRRRA